MAERDRKPKFKFQTNIPAKVRLISGPREFTHKEFGQSWIYDLKHTAGPGQPEEEYVWFATPYAHDFLERIGAKPTSTWTLMLVELDGGKKGWDATDQQGNGYWSYGDQGDLRDPENAPERPQETQERTISASPAPDPQRTYRPVLAAEATILTKCLESATLMLKYIESLQKDGTIVFGGDQVCSIAATLFIQLKRSGLAASEQEVTDLWIKLKEIADARAQKE
tara:strand:- start:85 stop:756 length:672 start_codon:yes stop_codon:yes gene_type:complete